VDGSFCLDADAAVDPKLRVYSRQIIPPGDASAFIHRLFTSARRLWIVPDGLTERRVLIGRSRPLPPLWVWTVAPFNGYPRVRLSNQPEALSVPRSRFDFLARVAQTGPSWPTAGACLVSLVVTPARCSQAVAARAALPPYAARAAQPLSLADNCQAGCSK